MTRKHFAFCAKSYNECSKHIAEYIEKEYGSGIASEEIMFLAIHIKRVCMAG